MRNFFRKKMLNGILIKAFFACILLSSIACADDINIINEEPGLLEISSKKIDFLPSSTTKEIDLKSNISADDLTFEIPANARSWFSVEPLDTKIRLTVTTAKDITSRSTILTVKGLGIRQVVSIEQIGRSDGAKPNKDIQLFATSATASTFAENLIEQVDENGNPVLGEDGNPVMIPGKDHHPANHIIDGDIMTYHNSKMGEVSSWPFIYEVFFDNPADQINYISLTPRQDAGTRWGMFGEFDIFVSTTEKPEYTKVNDKRYDAGTKDKITFIAELGKSYNNVKSIKIELHNGYNKRASLAEMEFFKRFDFDPLSIFTDGSCSKIIAGKTQADIEAIPDGFYRLLADAILNNTYDNTGFRLQKYRPYQDPKIKADENATESYSVRDNPTGIYVQKANDSIYLFVGNTHGRKLILLLEEQQISSNDPKRVEKEYSLVEGKNLITPSSSGLLYIKYLVNDDIVLTPKTAAEQKEVDDLSVDINIFGGAVNGYYNSRKHSLEDWKRTLSYNVGAKTFDVQGDRIHLSWVKNVFKENLADPTQVIAYWDTILVLEQKFLGLEKYNDKGGIWKLGDKDRKPRNRMYVHTHPGNPAATSTRLHFPSPGYDALFYNAEELISRIWGPAHEMGHVNQMRPGLNWGGTIETTNNIYCCYIQHILGQQTRLELKNSYATAKARIIDAYEADPTNTQMSYSGYALDDDSHYEKIVPWWQLFLYMKVNGNEEFFMDVYEQYRVMGNKVPGFTGTDKNQSDNKLKDHGKLQTEFVIQACKAAKMDLREFFTKWGFLRVADMTWTDYNFRILKVTKERLKEIDKYIETEGKNWPKPTLKIWEINDQNYKEFKDPAFNKK